MLEQLVRQSDALEKALAGEELTEKDGIELMQYDNLHMLGAAADRARVQVGRRCGNIRGIILHELHKCLRGKLPNVRLLQKKRRR